MSSVHSRSLDLDDEVDKLLLVLPEVTRHRLVPLLKGAPALLKRMVGRRFDRSLIHRWAETGSHGVLLHTALVGASRYVTAAWLARFFLESAAAKRGTHLKKRHSAQRTRGVK